MSRIHVFAGDLYERSYGLGDYKGSCDDLDGARALLAGMGAMGHDWCSLITDDGDGNLVECGAGGVPVPDHVRNAMSAPRWGQHLERNLRSSAHFRADLDVVANTLVACYPDNAWGHVVFDKLCVDILAQLDFEREF